MERSLARGDGRRRAHLFGGRSRAGAGAGAGAAAGASRGNRTIESDFTSHVQPTRFRIHSCSNRRRRPPQARGHHSRKVVWESSGPAARG